MSQIFDSQNATADGITVLFIAPLPPPTTGQSVACQALYDDLVVRGYRVSLVNLSKNTFRQGVSSIGRVFQIAKMVFDTLCQRASADCVYFTPAESLAGNLKDLLILAVLGDRLRHTYLHLHGGAGMRVLLSEQHPWLRRLNGWFLGRVAGVIVLGHRHEGIYEDLVAHHRIHVVKNFAPDALFVNDEELVEKWAITGKRRVLFLSNLLPGKGYEELVRAIDMLPPEVAAQCHFDFAGGFESEAALQAFKASIEHLPNIIYHGTVHGDAKRELLRQAHLFCLPTYYPYEGQPISILEAYAAGCAVITTDHSGIFDIFTPGENGWEVAARDAKELTAVLERFVANPVQGARIGRANAQVARSCYRREHHLAKLRQTLGFGEV